MQRLRIDIGFKASYTTFGFQIMKRLPMLFGEKKTITNIQQFQLSISCYCHKDHRKTSKSNLKKNFSVQYCGIVFDMGNDRSKRTFFSADQ